LANPDATAQSVVVVSLLPLSCGARRYPTPQFGVSLLQQELVDRRGPDGGGGLPADLLSSLF
jgi:hypothetical protein